MKILAAKNLLSITIRKFSRILVEGVAKSCMGTSLAYHSEAQSIKNISNVKPTVLFHFIFKKMISLFLFLKLAIQMTQNLNNSKSNMALLLEWEVIFGAKQPSQASNFFLVNHLTRAEQQSGLVGFGPNPNQPEEENMEPISARWVVGLVGWRAGGMG